MTAVDPQGTSVSVLGVNCFAGNLVTAADDVLSQARSGSGGYACFCNVHVLVTAQHDEDLRAALTGAWRVFADGAPIAWLQRRLGADPALRVGGPDLMRLVFERGQEQGPRHFLFGSTREVLDKLQRRVLNRFPRASIVGSYAPGFGQIEERAIQRIREARPDVIWCALGAPRQELWMARHAEALEPAVVLGVGAAFEFMAGTKPRAPVWMQRGGLEWLFRMAIEPRRLSHRYITTNSEFAVRALGELVWPAKR